MVREQIAAKRVRIHVWRFIRGAAAAKKAEARQCSHQLLCFCSSPGTMIALLTLHWLNAAEGNRIPLQRKA